MAKRHCIEPGCRLLTTRTRCAAHEKQRTAKHDADYGPDYQRARRNLLADHPACHWCGQPATTADHDPPLAHGGDHTTLVPACGRCNSSRGGHTRR